MHFAPAARLLEKIGHLQSGGMDMTRRNTCFGRRASAGALLLAGLLTGCAVGAPWPPTETTPIPETSLVPEVSSIAGSGGDWFAIEDGDLVSWGELYGGEDYSQRVTLFQRAQSVWGYRFGQLVLDESGDLWTTGSSGHEKPLTRDGWQFVLSDVVTASGNIWNAAAVCSDGSLWTWGKNDQGQLGNGECSEDATNYPPQHIMDGVRLVRLGSYAVTTGGELYGIGLWSGCTEPKLLCRNVADVAAGGLNRIQILTPEGELYLAEVPDRPGQPLQLPKTPAAIGVSEIFDEGYRDGDGICFLWNIDATESFRLELEAAQITQNLDGILVLTENGDYVRARVTDTQLTLTPLSAAKLSPGGELPVAQAPDIEHGCVLHDCRPQRVGGWNICPPNFFVPALSFRSPCFVCPPGSRPDASTNNFLLPW